MKDYIDPVSTNRCHSALAAATLALFFTLVPSAAIADSRPADLPSASEEDRLREVAADRIPEAAPAPSSAEELGLLETGIGLELAEFDIFDEFALLTAEDFVVSASRRRQRIEESPSAITVITREQILASGYDNLVDLLRLVPGADV